MRLKVADDPRGFLFRNDVIALERGVSTIDSRRAPKIWREVLLWGLVVGLVSPLALYAGSEAMPLAGLFAVAAGLALALALVGRQLADLMLEDALARRPSSGRRVLASGALLLVLILVILSLVIATLFLRRRGMARILPVP